MNFGECVLAHPPQGSAEGEGAIFVGDPDIDIFPVPDAQPLRIGRVSVNVPCRNDQPIGSDASSRPQDRHLGCGLQPAAVTHGYINAQGEAVGARYFDLCAFAQRAEYGNTLEPALWSDEGDPFLRRPMSRLSQRCRLAENVVLAE